MRDYGACSFGAKFLATCWGLIVSSISTVIWRQCNDQSLNVSGEELAVIDGSDTLNNSANANLSQLYVKTLTSVWGPEGSINRIFQHARRNAPCYLVFEDLDSIVTDEVRSFFLNAVDGIAQNEGILMVGSTNHLDRLDPGLAKRPSRFDRKYHFPNPALDQRIAYLQFWQRRLADSDVEFPDMMCQPGAAITKGFSFAYIQEAMVSALLTIARKRSLSVEKARVEESDLDDYVLWREFKKQVRILREELDEGDSSE